MYSVNQQGAKIVKEQIIPYAEQLGCKVHVLESGATVVDMGIVAPGGWRAGKLFVEATIGGMGAVEFGRFQLGEIDLPSIDVYIDHPIESTLVTQFSGWPMLGADKETGIKPIGSGPARAIAKFDPFALAYDYTDHCHEAVFGAQCTSLPGEETVADIAEKTGCRPENIYILAATSGSLVGCIQVCSRTVEATSGRLWKKGFDLSKIIAGMGTCPVPPCARSELTGIDRVNTALLYGATVRWLVDCTDAEIEAVLDELPFSASRRYGEEFIDLFEEGKRDFYIVDKDIHTIACYEINNIATGHTFKAGVLREDMLKKSFFN